MQNVDSGPARRCGTVGGVRIDDETGGVAGSCDVSVDIDVVGGGECQCGVRAPRDCIVHIDIARSRGEPGAALHDHRSRAEVARERRPGDIPAAGCDGEVLRIDEPVPVPPHHGGGRDLGVRGHLDVRRGSLDEATVTAVRRRGVKPAADTDGACHHAAQQRDGTVMVFHRARLDHAGVVDHAGDQRIFGAGCHDDLSAVSPDQAAVFGKTVPNAPIHLQVHETVVAERQCCGAAGCQSDRAQLGGDHALIADMTTLQHHITTRGGVDRALVDDARGTVAAEELAIRIGAGGIEIQRRGHQATNVDLRTRPKQDAVWIDQKHLTVGV